MKDFKEFSDMMGFRFPNDIQKIAKASELAGGTISAESLSAAFAVSLYMLHEYHEWLNN